MMMIKVMPSWIFLIVLVACIISPRRVLADFPNVPLIDVGRWISSSGSSSSSETTTDSVDPSSSLLLEQQRIVNEILEACKSVGFFTIINHGIDTTVIQEAWKASAEFFNLSIEEKMNHNANGDDAEYPYGYEQKEQLSKGKALDGDSNGGDESSMMMNTDDDIPILESKETYAIGPNNIQSGMPLRRWVNTPSVPTFRIALETYYEQMESLALRLLQLFALALGQPISYFESKMDHHMSALRLIHYYPLNDTSTEEPKRRVIRAGAHTDYGALTILNAGQPGLQVLRRDLENQNRTEWYSVPLVPNAFVINLGDLMQRWTNDEWVSTLHRVVMTTGRRTTDSNNESSDPERRYSMAFFVNINGDTMIDALTGEKSKYPPISAKNHLMAKHLASMGKVLNSDHDEL